jgi:hypothetical protein
MFFLLFLLEDKRIRIRIQEAQKHTDPTDPDPDSDPDPQLWYKVRKEATKVQSADPRVVHVHIL